MSDMDISTILDDLAAGRIDAAEAKRRIDEMGFGQGMPQDQPVEEVSNEWRQPTKDEPKSDTVPPAQPQPSTQTPLGSSDPTSPWSAQTAQSTPPKADKINGIQKILVKATGRKVKIVADPMINTASAEDVHQVKRNGGVLEIIGERDMPGVGDAISWVRSIKGINDIKEDIRGLSFGKELTVRVNPLLEVDLDISASSLQVTDVPHLGKVRLTASQGTISGARVVSDLLLQAGQVTVSGVFTEDWSRFRCESGQTVIIVDPQSDVVIRADSQLGRVSWEGVDGSDAEVTVGHGTAHLDLGVVLGHGAIKIGKPDPIES